MIQTISSPYILRNVQAEDGIAIWKVAADSQSLDLNSSYCYIMLCEYFSKTCYIATVGDETVGFVTAFLHPSNPKLLFIWQIAVIEPYRGKGIGLLLLKKLIDSKSCENIEFVEVTVAFSNKASRHLFKQFAEYLNTPIEQLEGFSSTLFPNQTHEDEPLLRIGPILGRL